MLLEPADASNSDVRIGIEFNGPVIVGKPIVGFDSRAFVLPAQGNLRNRGPWIAAWLGPVQLDTSLFKEHQNR